MAISSPDVVRSSGGKDKFGNILGAIGVGTNLLQTIVGGIQNRKARKEQEREFNTQRDMSLLEQAGQSHAGGLIGAMRDNPELVKGLIDSDYDADFEREFNDDLVKNFNELYGEDASDEKFQEWKKSGKWKEEGNFSKRDIRQYERNQGANQVYDELSGMLMRPEDAGRYQLSAQLQQGVPDTNKPPQQIQNETGPSYQPIVQEQYEEKKTLVPGMEKGKFEPLQKTTSDVRSTSGGTFEQMPLNKSERIVADPNQPDFFYTDLVGIMDLAGRVKNDEEGNVQIADKEGNWYSQEEYEKKFNIPPNQMYKYEGETNVEEFNVQKQKGQIDPNIPQNSSTFVENYINPDEFSNIDNWNRAEEGTTMEGIKTPDIVREDKIKIGENEIGNYDKNSQTFTFYPEQQQNATEGTLNDVIKLQNDKMTIDNPIMRQEFAKMNGWDPNEMSVEAWYEMEKWKENKSLMVPSIEKIPVESALMNVGGETKSPSTIEFENNMVQNAGGLLENFKMNTSQMNGEEILRHRTSEEYRDVQDIMGQIARYDSLQFLDRNGKFSEEKYNKYREYQQQVIDNFGGEKELMDRFLPNEFKLNTFIAMANIAMEAKKLKLAEKELNWNIELSSYAASESQSGVLAENYQTALNNYNKVIKEQFDGDTNAFLEQYGKGNDVLDGVFNDVFRSQMYLQGYTPEQVNIMIANPKEFILTGEPSKLPFYFNVPADIFARMTGLLKTTEIPQKSGNQQQFKFSDKVKEFLQKKFSHLEYSE